MELIDTYLKNQVIRFRLWITNADKQIHEVRCESLDLKPHDIYTGYHKGTIIMEKWVWEGIMKEAPFWPERLIMLLTENGYQDVTPYKIVSNELIKDIPPVDKVYFKFVCQEEKDE